LKKTNNLKNFENQFSQLKTYYDNKFEKIEESKRKMLILGLNLLRLLAQNRISEFHIELELIPIEKHNDMYIKHAIDLELYLMEGSYKKIIRCTSKSSC